MSADFWVPVAELPAVPCPNRPVGVHPESSRGGSGGFLDSGPKPFWNRHTRRPHPVWARGGRVDSVGAAPPKPSLEQPQPLQLVGHLLGHVAGVSLGKIGRGVAAVVVAPALEGAAGARRGRDDGAPDLDSAVLARLLLVEVLLEADQLLAAADDAPHHPVERAALQQLLDPLGHVAGIDPVRRTRSLAALLAPRRLHFLHVREIVDADGKLYQV